jgi:hypothetical protein
MIAEVLEFFYLRITGLKVMKTLMKGPSRQHLMFCIDKNTFFLQLDHVSYDG